MYHIEQKQFQYPFTYTNEQNCSFLLFYPVWLKFTKVLSPVFILFFVIYIHLKNKITNFQNLTLWTLCKWHYFVFCVWDYWAFQKQFYSTFNKIYLMLQKKKYLIRFDRKNESLYWILLFKRDFQLLLYFWKQ